MGKQSLNSLGFVTVLALFGASSYGLDSDGDGVSDAIESARGDDPLKPFQVIGGGQFACAIDDTGVVCWGLD